MAAKGHVKGPRFERAICGRLSLWVSDLEREDIFWRTAMSGGRATVGSKRGKRFTAQAGDISAVDPLGDELLRHFMVECKFYKRLEYEKLFYRFRGKFGRFWRMNLAKAQEHGKELMLVAKENKREELVGITPAGYEMLKCGPSWPRLIARFPGERLCIITLRDLITKVRFRHFIKKHSK